MICCILKRKSFSVAVPLVICGSAPAGKLPEDRTMEGRGHSQNGRHARWTQRAVSLKKALAGLAVVLALAGYSAPSSAANWYSMPGTTSADLARDDWRLLSSSGLSWPDGRQAIVTFWKNPDTAAVVRCISYFEVDMSGDGEVCEQAT
jgi:hypothetical protein